MITDDQTLLTTATTQAYAAHDQPKGAAYTKKTRKSEFTGDVMVQYHGANNNDTIITQRNALNEPVEITNTEHNPIDGSVHTTGKQFTYHRQTSGLTVREIALNNKTQAGEPYAITTHYDALQRKLTQSDNLVAHQRNGVPVLLQENTYNDLGELASSTSNVNPTPRNNALAYQKKVIFCYDAQARRISQSTIQAKKTPAYLPAGSINAQQITQITQYDDVANTVTRHEEGYDGQVDGDSFIAQADVPPELSTQTTTTLNEANKVIAEQERPRASASLSYTDTPLTPINGRFTYNNFTEKVAMHTTANASNAGDGVDEYDSYDALGELTQANMGQDEQVHLLNDINHHLVSKTLSNDRGKTQITPYFFVKGIQGETLDEYRGHLEQTNNPLYVQHYHYDSPYKVIQYAWSKQGTNASPITTTNYYGDVNNKKVLLQQVVENSQDSTEKVTITYDYNYALGLENHQTRQDEQGRSTTDKDYRADGKIISIAFDKGTANEKTMAYTYYGADTIAELDQRATKQDVAAMLTTYQYDAGKLTQVQLTSPQKALLASIQSTYTRLNDLQQKQRKQWVDGKPVTIDTIVYGLDQFRRLIHVNFKTADTQTTTGTINYVYKPATNDIQQRTDVEQGNATPTVIDYTYDDADHLATSTLSHPGSPTPAVITNYNTDAMGNVITRVASNQTQLTTPVFDYDVCGQYTGSDGNKAIAHDDQGNAKNDDVGGQLAWSLDNRLTQYTNTNGLVTHYRYTSYGRVKTQTIAGKTVNLHSYYADNRLSNTIEIDDGHAIAQSAYLAGSVRIVANMNAQVSMWQYLQADKTGTVTNSLTITPQGKRSSHYQYSDYGQQINVHDSNSTHLSINFQPLRFNHDYVEQESLTGKGAELDYKRARELIHFASGVAQFASQDYGQQLVSNFAYDKANPVRLRDGLGHNAGDVVLKVMTGALAVLEAVNASFSLAATPRDWITKAYVNSGWKLQDKNLLGKLTFADSVGKFGAVLNLFSGIIGLQALTEELAGKNAHSKAAQLKNGVRTGLMGLGFMLSFASYCRFNDLIEK